MDAEFIDLDILLTRIRNTQSKKYFRDAVKAYKAGALRASMTSVWVALVYDLIAKYRELSAIGDSAATAFITSWDNATSADDIKKLLHLEAMLLEDATSNTQVISRTTRTQLLRLREDRHLCAHPAFSAEAELYEPSPELVRLHLVNTVNFVLSQEPLQGKAIFNLFDIDVQSVGFPANEDRILDYVEQRYLDRVRTQNIRNFGAVLAKSLIKGVPTQWEPQQSKITSSLVAIRERAAQAWPDISGAIVRLIDNLEPEHRIRAISFLAAFPNFWPLLLETTRMALQATVDNTNTATLDEYRILSGVNLPYFRESLMNVITELNEQQIAEAIVTQPIIELWPRAIAVYRASGSYRGSEVNFLELILPFSGRLSSQEFDQLMDAIVENGQNWDAAQTDTLLLGLLQNTPDTCWPTPDARSRFYQHVQRMRRQEKYASVLDSLQSDGWTLPPLEPDQEI